MVTSAKSRWQNPPLSLAKKNLQVLPFGLNVSASWLLADPAPGKSQCQGIEETFGLIAKDLTYGILQRLGGDSH
jgi:hypothetical protein